MDHWSRPRPPRSRRFWSPTFRCTFGGKISRTTRISLFNRMSQMADRVVIDSAAFDHPYEDLLRLGTMIGDKSRRLLASDLNWGRLTSWRSLLASFWDVPAYRPLLDKIDRVTIAYRPSSKSPDEVTPAAVLLAAWLSASSAMGVCRQQSSSS